MNTAEMKLLWIKFINTCLSIRCRICSAYINIGISLTSFTSRIMRCHSYRSSSSGRLWNGDYQSTWWRRNWMTRLFRLVHHCNWLVTNMNMWAHDWFSFFEPEFSWWCGTMILRPRHFSFKSCAAGITQNFYLFVVLNFACKFCNGFDSIKLQDDHMGKLECILII